MRSWARRRVLQAIVDQLKVQGFDANGRKLKPANPEVASDANNVYESLLGIVDVHVQEKSIGDKYEEVLRQAGLLVQEILTRCGKWKASSNEGALGLARKMKPRKGT